MSLQCSFLPVCLLFKLSVKSSFFKHVAFPIWRVIQVFMRTIYAVTTEKVMVYMGCPDTI